jgi:porin
VIQGTIAARNDLGIKQGWNALRVAIGLTALVAVVGFPARADDATAADAPNARPASGTDDVLAYLDSRFLRKGLNSSAATYTDSMLGDYAGLRSAAAEYGFGFQWDNTDSFAYNVLDVARSGRGPLLGPNMKRSSQQYWGQKPSFMNTTQMYLIYDTARHGIPDGQLLIGGVMSWASWQAQGPSKIALYSLSWYQSMFDKRFEIRVGYVPNNSDWIGTSIGGTYASTLGGSASVQYAMGLSTAGIQPTAKATWHISDSLYNQFGVIRSYPIGGATGSTMMNNEQYNPTGFTIDVPNGKVLLMDEIGYKSAAAPGRPYLWVRAGWMHNQSRFANHKTGGTDTGLSSGYLLADAQLLQTAPGSKETARRGFYAGGTVMFGAAQNLPIYRYYEGRLYLMGPFAERTYDQIALVYSYSAVNKYYRNTVNQTTAATSLFANAYASNYMATYMARLKPGLYATLGLSYAGNPSIIRTPSEGHSLNAQFILYAHL